eukprot:10354758-Lingulodinium_polyedra.AAC.1
MCAARARSDVSHQTISGIWSSSPTSRGHPNHRPARTQPVDSYIMLGQGVHGPVATKTQVASVQQP